MDLDDVLSNEEPKPEPAPEPQTEAKAEAPARDETGKFAAKQEKTEEPAAPAPEAKPESEPKPEGHRQQAMSDKERALLAAATDERRKRQQLEQELAQWRSQAQQPQQPQQPDEPQKTFWDDPDGALKAFEQRIGQYQQQTQHAAMVQHVSMSEAAAKVRHPDFNDVIPAFAEVLQATPGLYQQWVASSDPAEFAYRIGKNIRSLHEAGSVEAIKEQARKEARIALEAEYKAKEQALAKEREALPESLSGVRGTSSQRVTWGGPTPLENILKH